MKIAVAQIDPVVGAFEANVKKIREAYKLACSMQADVLITPELSVCGYSPHDLVERPEIFDRCEAALAELMAATKGESTALAVGHVAKSGGETGRAAQNVITILEDGKRAFRQAKMLLPTYDVFDEARYFEPASEIKLWSHGGKKIAIAICEDLWANDPVMGRPLYAASPSEKYRELGADLVLSLSASPYEFDKRERREAVHAEVAKNLKAPLVYVNQVGATDEVLFDGGSFAVDAKGKLLGRLPVFKTSFGIFDVGAAKWDSPEAQNREDDAPSDIETLHRALVCGLREYFAKTGFTTALLGLSGGIDSAVVAVLAAQALGPKNILGLAMPSQNSSGHSLADAETLAKNLGINFEVRPIKFLFSTVLRDLSERRGTLADLAQENLQARLRGLVLMTLSNHYSALVLSTSNKSELAMGYSTLYGDMNGALAPLADVYKTRVYELAKHLNATSGAPIPESTMTKAPSAELRPNQTDQDSLPKYDALDAVLLDYVENGLSVEEMVQRHGKLDPGGAYAGKAAAPAAWIADVVRKVELNEYKRRQAPPPLKISRKAFGIGRRIPIAKTWDQ